MSKVSITLESASETSVQPIMATGGKGSSCRVLIPFFTPFLYGMERAVIEIFAALRPEVEPHFVQSYMIACRRPPVIEEMANRGFEMSLLPDKKDWIKVQKPKSLRQFWQLLEALVLGNIAMLKAVRGLDVLYIPAISYAYSSILAALAFRLRGRRIIHHFHDIGTKNSAFWRVWQRLVTDCIHNTQYGCEVVARTHPGIRRKRNFVVPCIMDLQRPVQEDLDAIRLLRGKRNIFYIGQVSWHKGIDLLLESFKPIAEAHPDVMLHMIGGCAPTFQEELNRTIAQLPLSGRVKCWGFREDGLLLLRHAYVYVHPSPPSRFHESFGRAVVEAMSLGIPTVCFCSGALREIVVHQRTGLVCEENFSFLTAALAQFLANSGFRNECAANARARYVQLYSPNVARERWESIFFPPNHGRSSVNLHARDSPIRANRKPVC